MKKFLFKRAADGKWIFGNKTTSICKAGLYRIDPLNDGETFALYAVYNRDISLNFPNRFDDYKKENGTTYASLAEFLTATADFFDPGGVAISVTGGLTNEQLRAAAIPLPSGASTSANQDMQLGAYGCQIVTGAVKTNIKAGFYAFASTCRIDGSKIASLEKTVGEVVSADNDEAITGIAMYPGEYQPFINKVISVTQTAAGDSITYWLKPLS